MRGLSCAGHMLGQILLDVSFTARLCQLDGVKSDGGFYLRLKPS